MMSIFGKKEVVPTVTGTEKLRQHLRAKTRHWSLIRIAEEINDTATIEANRTAARAIAARMAGDDASPEVTASIAKTLISGGFSGEAKRDVSSTMLETFLEGDDLPTAIKARLAECLHAGHTTFDAESDQLVSAFKHEPRKITASPPQWVHPDPAIAKAQADYKAAVEAARRR